jgi:hypothetical protein
MLLPKLPAAFTKAISDLILEPNFMVSHGTSISLLHWDGLSASDRNVIKIVELLGGVVRTVRLSGQKGEFDHDASGLKRNSCCVMSASALSALLRCTGRTREVLRILTCLGTKFFIYGFQPSADNVDLLWELTSGMLTGVVRLPMGRQQIKVADESVCGQLAGLTFEGCEIAERHAFVREVSQNCRPILSIAQKSFCVRVQSNGLHLFLVAGSGIADVDAKPPDTSILRYFASLAPLLIFLRYNLGERLWHNDSPRACFVVDDPPLKKRYGHLEYHKLTDLMDRTPFSASIAFIPWNYKRSQKQVIEMFSGRSMSLCMHGCDHTWGEFDSNDPWVLQQKALEALKRMQWHRSLSGLDFDDVMVFPQGLFSTAAMDALSSCGYLAALNSTAFPVDAAEPPTLRDLLQLAVTRYSNFPLFMRWYPEQFAELAFNIFLGKPALLVEHHAFFRNGYAPLAQIIERLSRLEPRLQWASPGEICSQACWQRTAENGDGEVLFVTDRFSFRNRTGQSRQYAFIRQGLSEPGIRVTINGRQTDVSTRSDDIQFNAWLDSGEGAQIMIHREKTAVAADGAQPPFRYRAGVFIRRILSEFRVNLQVNPFVPRRTD